jgi:hypothetical protein
LQLEQVLVDVVPAVQCCYALVEVGAVLQAMALTTLLRVLLVLQVLSELPGNMTELEMLVPDGGMYSVMYTAIHQNRKQMVSEWLVVAADMF